MALESASYISQLNTANPAPTDLIGQGDDHIRLIKAVLKATFPNITGPVNLTDTELNDLLASLGASGVPVGVITSWYGASGDVPTGWAICNGQTVARTDGSGNITTPDLRNLVVIGAGSVAAQGAAHGAANQTATTSGSGAHSHTATGGSHTHPGLAVGGHALTISEIPAHTHGFIAGGTGSSSAPQPVDLDTDGSVVQQTRSTGGGAAHTHDIAWPGTPDGSHSHTTDAAAAHTHGVTVSVYQPALALHQIMKV